MGQINDDLRRYIFETEEERDFVLTHGVEFVMLYKYYKHAPVDKDGWFEEKPSLTMFKTGIASRRLWHQAATKMINLGMIEVDKKSLIGFKCRWING